MRFFRKFDATLQHAVYVALSAVQFPGIHGHTGKAAGSLPDDEAEHYECDRQETAACRVERRRKVESPWLSRASWLFQRFCPLFFGGQAAIMGVLDCLRGGAVVI